MSVRSNDPLAALYAEITRLRGDVDDLIRRPLRIPVLDADPSADSGTNAWLLEDGRLRVRNAAGTIKEYAPVGAPGGGSSGTAKPTPPAPKKTRVITQTATWGQTYRQSGAQRTDTRHLYYGYADTFNGRQKSLIGFNYGTIQAALAGSTITKVELFIHQLHSWWHTGAELRFGIHNNATEPATYGGIVHTNVSRAKFGKPQAKWVTVATEFGIRFRDGSGRGVSIDNFSSDRAFYGFAAGIADSGSPPAIRITYVK